MVYYQMPGKASVVGIGIERRIVYFARPGPANTLVDLGKNLENVERIGGSLDAACRGRLDWVSTETQSIQESDLSKRENPDESMRSTGWTAETSRDY